MKNKSLFFILLLAVFMPWAAKAQTVTIGEGTSTDYYTPIGCYHNYSFSEQLYLASEINQTGYILSLNFYYSGSVFNKDFPIVVYMKAVDDTDLSSGWISLSATDQVFSGTLSVTASGWQTIELDTPFNYDGTKNLLIAVDKAYLKWYSNGTWRHTSATSMTRYYCDDSTDPNPLSPPSGSLTNNRPNVQLTFGVPPTCFAPKNLTCTEYTATSATLTWQRHASGTETAWVLQYSEDNTFATGVQSVNVNTTPSKELTGLTAEHTYYARVRPDCNENLWSDVCEFKPSVASCNDIGTGSESANLVFTSWGCTYSQHIYTADELTDMGFSAGDIVSVSFHYSGTSSTYSKTQSIYMGTTTKSSYSGNTATDFESDVTLVYGPTLLSYVAGWREYELTEPFTWDGTSNIVVGMLTNSTHSSSSGWSAYGTSTSPNYRSICRYKDSSPIDITNLSAVNNGTSTYSRPNIHLCILPSTKPRNLTVSNITSSQATISWDAPASGTPTDYEFEWKRASESWTDHWTSSQGGLAVDITGLPASTDFVVRVRAIYAEGNSDPIETEFRTLDACAFPTNFTATTTPGLGTEASFSWVKGYDETAWVLQIATDADFTVNVDDFTQGFVVDGNNVTYNATGLTAEQTYYARVKADCDGPTSQWSNVATFTPTNYVDYTFGNNATSTTSYVPFYGSYTNYGTLSQFIITASNLTEVSGGTIRRMTFHSSTASASWGNATFDVYVKEVEASSFASSNAEGLEDWTSMTNVYSGSLSVSGNQMVISFTEPFSYNGGNLMIGFNETTLGTGGSVSWYYVSGQSNAALYGYKSYSYSTYSYEWSYSRTSNIPKITFNYLPTPYKYPVIDEANCTFGTTTAHIAWTVTGATPTGYQYQYKLASATEWPTAWTSATTAYADLGDLIAGSPYDFRVKALYEGNHESVEVDYSFFTECAVVTAFPWSEKFETYDAGDFNHPCWVNEHISGDGTNIFKVYTSTTGSNTTHQLQLPDQSQGTLTKLRLPEMNLPSNNYQFVFDIYRNTNTYSTNPHLLEGIRVFASTDGNIEGATELAFVPRHIDGSNSVIPSETATGWYTYEIPIGISGTCFIILQGENQFVTAVYMDNLTVEQIPTCARPSELAYSNVTNHSATIEWTAGDAEQTLWQIAYSKTSFDPNTANFDVTTVTTIDATAHPFTLDKILDPESTYYVYVRANCGTAAEPDFGPWNRKGISFTTQVATPAPSNFVASNPASAKVDLVWNAGGGDFESWELYYVASETAPEAPTASTTATVSNITTLPTTEAPYVLEGLNPVTKYYAWIRAKHVWNSETTYSDWVALTGSYFETLDACPTPTDLVATNLTSVSADLSWVGSDDVDSYTVQYRTAAGMGAAILSEEFASTSVPTNWTTYKGLFNETEGTATLTTDSYGWYFGTDHSLFNSNHAYVNIYGNNQKWLVTPNITLGEGNVLTFDLALTAYSSSVTNPQTTGTDDKFIVLVSTDNKATWNVLCKWDNAGSPYVYNEIAVAGESITLDLSSFDRQSVYIAFYGESTTSNADNNLHIDNVMVGTPTTAGDWIDATTNVEEQFYQLTGLTAGTKYDVQVKSNCTNGEWSDPVTFTTLAEGNMVFTNATTDGKWGTAGNWVPAQMPVLTDEVILRANATIESGCVAQANTISQGTYTITIEDGAKLKSNSSVTATVKKNIEGYDDPDNPTENTGWYLIANPLTSDVTPNATNGLLSGTYNLYRWDYTQELEWKNYRTTTFYLSSSNYTNQGYLYANENDTELSFTGTIRAANTNVYRSATYPTSPQNFDFPGWYLMGNSFMCDAYLATANTGGTGLPYYRMNSSHNGFVATPAGTAIAPMEGIFYEFPTTATTTTYVYITTTAPAESQGNLNMVVSQGRGSVDNAIIHFGEGQQLGKFSFREGSTKVYIPQDGKDYAVVNAEAAGEMPVNFKAEENGTYTLSFTNEEVTFSYLHLIDNLTGADIDLLQTPSYTFNAKTTDYSSRFKLVFCTGINNNSDSFAFFSNGNWIIGNEGEATLQVIDVTGRILSSETVNGSVSKAINAAPGVYMIRLINGDNVKVQKIVVK